MMRSYGHAANDRLPPGEAVAAIASLCVSCWLVIGFAVFLILRMFGAV